MQKNKLFIAFFSLLLLAFIFTPSFVLAITDDQLGGYELPPAPPSGDVPTGATSGSGTSGGGTAGGGTSGGSDALKEVIQLSDPLGSTVSNDIVIGGDGSTDFEITDLIGRIANALIAPVGAIAFLFFVIGGFYWIFSGGNEERIKAGKDIMLWTLVGVAIIFFAYAILSFLFKIVLPA